MRLTTCHPKDASNVKDTLPTLDVDAIAAAIAALPARRRVDENVVLITDARDYAARRIAGGADRHFRFSARKPTSERRS